jgi:hypothetical protein
MLITDPGSGFFPIPDPESSTLLKRFGPAGYESAAGPVSSDFMCKFPDPDEQGCGGTPDLSSAGVPDNAPGDAQLPALCRQPQQPLLPLRFYTNLKIKTTFKTIFCCHYFIWSLWLVLPIISVSDPDPNWIRIQSVNQDPGGQK